jgi:hypothetical protein
MPERKSTPQEQAHDVLAAEEFGVPAPDPDLRHGPVTLPSDPSGIAEPHDVLAAEEFAMPAPSHRGAGAPGSERHGRSSRALNVAVGALALVLLWRLGRKRHS